MSDHASAHPTPRLFEASYWSCLLVGSALAAGLVARYLLRDYTTIDTSLYLLPWYEYAQEHGLAALAEAFTNYTPLYTYLLIAVSRLHGHVDSLSLIKAISALFELAAAFLAWRMTARPAAFAAVWLAPTVLWNGPAWGQADSIWAFFVLLAVYLYREGRNGVLPFGAAVATKAQGFFLGPFVLGMALRRREALWLASIPIVYFLIAAPTLIAGRPMQEIATVYVDQADTFRSLSVHAANLWALLDSVPYTEGVAIGVVLAAVAGIAITAIIASARTIDKEFVVLAACVALLVMPYLLPKMHERYFYAFEVTVIVLAFLNWRYAPFAILAQVSGVLAYLVFDRGFTAGLTPAAIINGFMAAMLSIALWRAGRTGVELPRNNSERALRPDSAADPWTH